MGVLSNLIAQKNDIDTKRKQAAIQGLQTALTNPNATPETREWAMESIASLADDHFGHGGGKGKGGAGGGGQGGGKGAGIGQFFKSILGGLVSPYTGSQGVKQGVQQIDKARPAGPMTMTPEQQEAQANKFEAAAMENRAQIQAKIDAAKLKAAREQNQAAYEEAYQRNLKAFPNDPVKAREIAEEEVYNKNRPTEPKPNATGKPTKQFVLLPGETEPRLAWVTPGLPGGVLVDSGEQLPEGWKPAAAPSGADARTTYAQLLRSLHDEHPEWTKEQLQSAAGTEYQRKYGLEIGKAEQTIAINEVLSGIGGGAYTPKPAGTGEQPKPKLQPKTTAPGPGASTTTPARTGAPTQTIDQSAYLADLLGNNKATGPEKVRVIKGREQFKSLTGLNPVEFEALAASDKGTAKAIIDTVERQASVQRVNEVLNQFGDEAVKRAREVAKSEPDSPILKKPIRELTTATVGNPALARFLLAYNGFQRQYSTLTAGAGGLSRAQLPVGIADKVDRVLDPNATLETVIQAVDQVKIEGQRELAGFNQARGDMAKMIEFSLGKQGQGQGGGQSGKYKEGDKVRLKDGTTVTIKKLNPDGTFEY